MLVYALILTVSTSVRERSWEVEYTWIHWIGVLVWMTAFYLAHITTKNQYPYRDPYLIPISALLSGWGLMAVYRLYPTLGTRQSVWLLLAVVVFITGLRVRLNLNYLRRYKYIWLTAVLALTALTFLLGTNPLGYGPRMWLGCCGIYFQPSEPLKLLLVVYLAAYFADQYPYLKANHSSHHSVNKKTTSNTYQNKPYQRKPAAPLLPLLAPTLVIMGLTLALLVVQRDLGTVLILFFVYTAILYVTTGQKKILIFTFLSLVLAFAAGYFLFDVVRLRLEGWINPWSDPSGSTYQIVQSLMAIANGGIIGRGPGLGHPGLVPIAHSDFIFSAITEESGLLGAVGLLVLLAIFCTRGLSIAIKTSNPFRSFLAAGITVLFAAQGFVIIAGNIRLLPLTGITLPFVSYGGSSLIITFISLLFLLIISVPSESKSNIPLPTKPYLHLGALIFIGLGVTSLVVGWWTIYRSPNLISRTDNPRRSISDRSVQRGSIIDRNNQPINITSGPAGDLLRTTQYPNLSNIVGYTDPTYGQTGLEASMDGYLRGWSGNPGLTVWWNHLLYGQPPPGWDIRLSISLELQAIADELMGDSKGGLVLLNGLTGEILAMSSQPAFDSNYLNDTWEALIEDKDSALFNRAAQGGYQPGASLGAFLLAESSSAGKISTADTRTQQTREMDYELDGYRLNCAQDPGSDTWGSVISAGCPAPAADLGSQLGLDGVRAAFQDLGFNSAPILRLETSGSPQNENINSPEEAALGSGLQISPLQLALAGAALSSPGVRPSAQIVSAVKSPQGDWQILPALDEPVQVFSPDTAKEIANALAVDGLPIWQIVATSPPPPGETEAQAGTWYLAGTLPDIEGTPLVLALLIEENNPVLAKEIGQNVLSGALNQSP